MIRVTVELLSAKTGETTELALMHISNDGTGTSLRGNYDGVTFRGRSHMALSKHVPAQSGHIENFPRQQQHVWHLVARMLATMGYGR